MLLRFGVSNHRSILEKQELSLVATSLKDGDDGLIEAAMVPGGYVLPSVGIYGANASGKSNVLSALRFLRGAVLYSHSRGRPDAGVPREPFKLTHEATQRPSVFDIDFVVDGIRYHFGFEATDRSFTGEWLYAFPSGRRQTLYERTGEKKISFGRSLKGRNRVIADLMRENSLFLSAAIQNNHEELTRIARFFRSLVVYSKISVEGIDISGWFEDADLDQRTIDFLTKTGTGIVGFQRVEIQRTGRDSALTKELQAVLQKMIPDLPDKSDKKLVSIELAHKGESGDKIFFQPDEESSGTRRLLILASSAFKALDRGSLIVVDELDASLHTQICEALIELFSNRKSNLHGAQIIVTTHDTNLMQSSILRRDQIWFAEKDQEGATHIFPLSDVQTRRSDNIEKGYLQGRFGAIPFAGSVMALLGE